MQIKIRDWEKHFEQDRTKQWKKLHWVPIPNKQGKGYRLIMKQKNGLEIFACWIAIVELASTCQPRGDLSKYTIGDISLLTLIDENKLKQAIKFLSEVLDWVEVIKAKNKNLDKNVKNLDVDGLRNCDSSSILFSSILSNSDLSKDTLSKNDSQRPKKNKRGFVPPTAKEFLEYCRLNGYSNIAERAYKYYAEADPPWTDSGGKPVRSWKSKLQAVWFKPENKDKPQKPKTDIKNLYT